MPPGPASQCDGEGVRHAVLAPVTHARRASAAPFLVLQWLWIVATDTVASYRMEPHRSTFVLKGKQEEEGLRTFRSTTEYRLP
jgi:hypothetical protein